jgi:hypothetical protein
MILIIKDRHPVGLLHHLPPVVLEDECDRLRPASRSSVEACRLSSMRSSSVVGDLPEKLHHGAKRPRRRKLTPRRRDHENAKPAGVPAGRPDLHQRGTIHDHRHWR